MKELYKVLVYAGLEPEEYRACQPAVRADNRKKLRAYLMTASSLMFLAAVMASSIPAMSAIRDPYGLGFLACLILVGLERLEEKNRAPFLLWMMYAFAALLYLVGIGAALSMPGELSVSYVAFSLAVPMLFSMRPVQHISNMLFFDAVFVVLVCCFETGMERTIDVVDTVAFGIVSCIISTYMSISKFQNFASQQQLQKIAHIDLLTGCKNRNAFERDRKFEGGGGTPPWGSPVCMLMPTACMS